MTPMASRVSNGSTYRLIFRLCFIKCCFSPWKPVYWIMCMLHEVRGFFRNQFIISYHQTSPAFQSLFIIIVTHSLAFQTTDHENNLIHFLHKRQKLLFELILLVGLVSECSTNEFRKRSFLGV